MYPESNVAEFFDSSAEAFNAIYGTRRNCLLRWADRHFRGDMYSRFTLSFEALGDLTGKTILDIGCGPGFYVEEALSRGARSVTAVDPALHMLVLVRKRLEEIGLVEKCSLVRGTFPQVRVEAHDHVILMGVTDYIMDPDAFLCALRPLVKISAVVSFPGKHWLRTPLRRFCHRLHCCSVYCYSEADIKALCSAAGFSGIKIRKIPGVGVDFHVCLKP